MITAREALEKEILARERDVTLCEHIITMMKNQAVREEEKRMIKIVEGYLEGIHIGTRAIQNVLDKLTEAEE